MAAEIVVLVSLGRNPASGRRRRAAEDAAAVEMALGLSTKDAPPYLLHAGAAPAAELREYLGMGVPDLTLLEVPDGRNPAVALLEHLRGLRPRLILSGSQAEAGETSGFLPFWLSHALGVALLTNIVALRREGEGWEATLAASGGKRRRMWAADPLFATVGPSAPSARAVAYGPAQRGLIHTRRASDRLPDLSETRTVRPARQRPRRLAAPQLAASSERGALIGLTPAEAARTIAAFLRERGLIG